MRTDALNRRLRFAKPQPLDERIKLTENDYAVFRALDRHGPLPTNYLFELTGRKDRNTFQNRLTKLYNGARNSPAFLVRPPQQFLNFEARYQPIIYDLAPRARWLLAEAGLAQRYAPDRTDPFVHRFMGACVSASIAFEAGRTGIRYIDKDEIFSHPKCPDATRRAPNPLSIELPSQRLLIPDDLFGFEYPRGGYRFFAVEIDRNTESIHRRRFAQNTFSLKLARYLRVLRERMHRSRWGLPNLTVLTVTTNAMHLENVLESVRREKSGLEAKFAFKALPAFGVNWKAPREVMTQLVADPWRRTVEPLHIGVSCEEASTEVFRPKATT